MSRPTLRILVAFNNGPLDDPAAITSIAADDGTLGATNVWTDLTAFLIGGYDMTRGADQIGTCQIVLDNSDGRFHEWNTSSPYAGLVKVAKLVQIRSTWNGVEYVRWTGNIDSLTEIWPDSVTRQVQISASDGYAFLEGIELSNAGYPTAIMGDQPAGYWRLADPVDSTSAADSSGNDHPMTLVSGTVDNLTFGEAGAMLADPATSVQMTAPAGVLGHRAGNLGGDPGIQLAASDSAVPSSPSAVVVIFWIKGTWATGMAPLIDTSFVFAGVTYSVRIQPGETAIVVEDLFGADSVDPAASVLDGAWHMVAVYIASGSWGMTVFVDGAVIYSGTFVFTGGGPTTPPSLALVNTAASGTVSVQYQDFAVTAAGIGVLAMATLFEKATWPEEMSDSRVGRALDAAGRPAGARILDTGDTRIQAQTEALTNTTALAHIEDVAETEAGRFYVDASGRDRFLSRSILLSADEYQTAQAIFGDLPGEIPYEPSSTPRIATDLTEIYNTATAQRQGGNVITTTDPASFDTYRRRTWRPTGQFLHTTDLEVRDRLAFEINNRKDQKPGVSSITVNLLSLIDASETTLVFDGPLDYDTGGTLDGTPVDVVAVLFALDLFYRVTVARATISGDAFSQDGLITSIQETVTAGSWTVVLGFDSAATTEYWIWDSSEWDAPDGVRGTVWAY